MDRNFIGLAGGLALDGLSRRAKDEVDDGAKAVEQIVFSCYSLTGRFT